MSPYINTTIIAIFLFLTTTVFAQTVYKFDVKLERVPQTHAGPTIRENRRILIVTNEKYFGIFDGYDTLDLVEVQPFVKRSVNTNIGYYEDVAHNNQRYYMVKTKHPSGSFSLFIIPYKPYKRRQLWSINIQSL